MAHMLASQHDRNALISQPAITTLMMIIGEVWFIVTTVMI